MAERRLNLLSLDGGGVRGLSSLCILQKLMEEVDRESPPKPCEFFDMIGGTSTGGLIAIMLGRLRMTVQQCIDEYTALSRQVFVRHITKGYLNWRGHVQERFDSEKLAAAIKAVVAKYDPSGDENALLKNDDKYGCKVFVCATNANTNDTALLASYPRGQSNTGLYENTSIWQAARATSAASSYFDRISIGPHDQTFLDGGTGANNPVRHLWMEAKQILSPDSPLEGSINCLVSIGTGIPSLQNVGPGAISIASSLLKIATETEQTATQFLREHYDLAKEVRYRRFNAPGVGDIALDKAEDLNAIAARTDHYFEDADVWEKVQSCAARLSDRENSDTTTYEQCQNLINAPEWSLYTGSDSSSQAPYNIFEIISLYDPERTCRKFSEKCSSTTDWILADPAFVAWLNGTGPACLWLHGIVGSGKTTVTTTVVEQLKQNRPTNTPVAYFFFDGSGKQRVKALDVLQSLAKQFLGSIGTRKKVPAAVISAVMKYYRHPPSESSRGKELVRSSRLPFVRSKMVNTTALPSLPTIREITEDILVPLALSARGLTIVVDGLDECDSSGGQVRELMKSLKDVIAHGSRVFISSRENMKVTKYIPQSSSIRLYKDNPRIREGLLRYIDEGIRQRTEEEGFPDNKIVLNQIRQKLSDKADAMFLWVRLLMDGLWHECKSDKDILDRLAHLPRSLDDTYQRCLARNKQEGLVYARRILKWVCGAINPLPIEVLKEALLIEEMAPLKDDSKYFSEYILGCGANLIILNKDQEVLPAHHSVSKWFFQGTRESSKSSSPTATQVQAEIEIGEKCVLSYTKHLRSRYIGNSASRHGNSQGSLIQTLIDSQSQRLPGFAKFLLNPISPSKEVPKLRQYLPQTSLRSQSALASLGSADQPFTQWAEKNWLIHTRSLPSSSSQWHNWQWLVFEIWNDIEWPWRELGLGISGHLSGLFGWAVVNQHFTVLEALKSPSSVLKQEIEKIRLFHQPLLNHGAAPPLVVALTEGNTEVANMLASVCDITQSNADGLTVFHVCAERGFSETLTSLCGPIKEMRATVERPDKHGYVPLHYAAQAGHLDIVSYLIGADCDPWITDAKGNCFLHLAAMNDWPQIIARSLLRFDVATYAKHFYREGWPAGPLRNNARETPLHVAIIHGHVAAAGAFLNLYKRTLPFKPEGIDTGWPLQARDNTSQQPLRHAIRRRNLGAVDLLLGAGIMCSHESVKLHIYSGALQDKPEEDVLKLIILHAKDNCENSLDEILYISLKERRYWIMEHLLACGANPNALFISEPGIHEKKTSSLIYLCTKDQAPDWVILHLVHNRADPTLCNDRSGISLVLVSLAREKRGALLLKFAPGYDWSSSINKGDSFGRTALWYAAKHHDDHLVRWLLSVKADPDIVDTNAHSPLWIAAKEQHWSTEQLMIEAGGRRIPGAELNPALVFPETFVVLDHQPTSNMYQCRRNARGNARPF